MRQKKWLILALTLLAVWFLGKNWAYRSIVGMSEIPNQDNPSYSGTENWIYLPASSPPGAWKDPWGVDLFLIPSPPSVKAGRGLVGSLHPQTLDSMKVRSRKTADLLSTEDHVYAPVYRHPSPIGRSHSEMWEVSRSDILSAFQQYLTEKNNWRGIVLVAEPDTHDLYQPVLERIYSDPRLLERFGGVVTLTSKDHTPANIRCSDALAEDCQLIGTVTRRTKWYRWLIPTLYRSPLVFEIDDAPTLAAQIDEREEQLSIWLDAHAPKPAEPLGGFEDAEVVGIAPIRRPGETDEELTKELKETIDE